MFSEDDRAREWLLDIVEYADRIGRYIAGRKPEDFTTDTMLRDAVERCVLVITEAAVRLGPDRMSELAPDVPLHALRGLGNLLRHGYQRVNARLMWDTASVDVPALRAACLRKLDAGTRP